MPEASFTNLLVVAAVGVAAPLLVALVPAIRVPAVVLEIVAGIVLGPAVLGWVDIDLPIQILALIGLAFLLFLAGLEIDLERLRGRLLRLAGLGYVITLLLAAVAGVVFAATGPMGSGALIGVALSATSLGLVVPVLKDAGDAERELGQLTIASASIADFAAILLLSLLFSMSSRGPAARLGLLVGFVLLVAAGALILSRLGRSMHLEEVLVRLQDTTAEIRVRVAVLLLVAFVVLAEVAGLETILGAFLAGAILGFVDRDAMSHPNFRLKLEAIGYGFLIPVFFIASGLRFDLGALVANPSALARVPLFLLALLVVRAAPAAIYLPAVGRRGAVAAGLLQATSLPLIVTATQIGLDLGRIDGATAAALVTAGLLSVVLFPPAALTLLRPAREPAEAGGGVPAEAVVPPRSRS
jgi:Kef-type K+ transport system membrane component KefB